MNNFIYAYFGVRLPNPDTLPVLHCLTFLHYVTFTTWMANDVTMTSQWRQYSFRAQTTLVLMTVKILACKKFRTSNLHWFFFGRLKTNNRKIWFWNRPAQNRVAPQFRLPTSHGHRHCKMHTLMQTALNDDVMALSSTRDVTMSHTVWRSAV